MSTSKPPSARIAMGQTQASGNTVSAGRGRRLFRMSCATYSLRFDSGCQRPREERRHSRDVPAWASQMPCRRPIVRPRFSAS
jgi:hypothetical protein